MTKTRLLLSLSAVLLLTLMLCSCGGVGASPTLSAHLSVTVSGTGTVTSTPSGINCGNQNNSCTASFPMGTTVSLTATPGSGQSFTGFSGGCSGASCSLSMNSDQSVTATFGTTAVAPSQLTVSVNGTGTVQSSPAGINCSGGSSTGCSASFPNGTAVTLTAAAPEDQTAIFTGWGGACSGLNACSLTMNSNQTVSATFATEPLLQVAVTGSGTVTSSPSGINCGNTCSAPFANGSTVSLTATPAAGFKFQSWGGACSGSSCSVTMSGTAVVVNATFTSVQPQVTVTLAGQGTGTVTSQPAGITCGTTCTASFPMGTSVTLAAAASSGSSFSGWGGACSGSAGCTFTVNSDTSVTATFSNGSPGSINAVNHILFLLQENRGFDHYFGHLNDYRAANGLPTDVDGTPATASNLCYKGAQCGFNGETTLAPFHLKTMCVENPSPSWNESHVDWSLAHPTSNPATLDGFVWEAAGDANNDGFHDTLGRRAMGYYTDADLPFYYFLANQFATSDRWFSPVMSRTHPNRMYSIAATSQGHVYPIPNGGQQLTAPTIFGELQKAGITWKIYGGSYTYYSMFSESNTLLNGHFFPRSQYFTDVANGTLPQVAWIEPGSDIGRDEHPGLDPQNPGPDVQVGSQWVSTLVNALMTSPSWKDSVFIISFDEGGGFYDHVSPFAEPNPDGIAPNDMHTGDICNKGETGTVNCNFDASGYRLPLMVVSPFSIPHYVSHTPMDYTAVLKFIETRFGLSPLTARDKAQPDMTEFFDFVNVPWATPPSSVPQQPTNGACYNNSLP